MFVLCSHLDSECVMWPSVASASWLILHLGQPHVISTVNTDCQSIKRSIFKCNKLWTLYFVFFTHLHAPVLVLFLHVAVSFGCVLFMYTVPLAVASGCMFVRIFLLMSRLVLTIMYLLVYVTTLCTTT
jgi:hypothetical protein